MSDEQRDNKRKSIEDFLFHGKRVYLRRLTMHDASNVFRWENDDEVWLYDPDRAYSLTIEDFLPDFERNYVRGNGRQFWFLIEDEQRVPIGIITYFNLAYINYDDRMGQVELGLCLGEKARWGQGYGPDTICTLVSYLFSRPNIVRVYANVASANQAGQRAFIKAGFDKVGQTGDGWVELEIWNPNGLPELFVSEETNPFEG